MRSRHKPAPLCSRKEFNLKNQLRGIALILFAGMLYAPLSPWLPILGSLPSDLISLVGLAFAIAGLVRCFKKED